MEAEVRETIGHDVEVKIMDEHEDTYAESSGFLEIGSVRSQGLVDVVGTLLTAVLVAALVGVSFLLGWHVRPDGPQRAIVVEVPVSTSIGQPAP